MGLLTDRVSFVTINNNNKGGKKRKLSRKSPDCLQKLLSEKKVIDPSGSSMIRKR